VSTRKPILAIALAGLAVLMLGGCITLLPKTKPALLYRFGGDGAAVAVDRPVTDTVNLQKGPMTFTRSAAGDGILTFVKSQAAYIAGARWIGPASVLFDEALTRAFAATPGPVRLSTRAEAGRADYVLRLDVRAFETRYARDGAAPTVVVAVDAVIIRASDRALIGEKVFESKTPATGNRVGAIVAAYDHAVAEVLGQLTAWTSVTATPIPKGP
jgi:cholesterol transport system auxiliary component